VPLRYVYVEWAEPCVEQSGGNDSKIDANKTEEEGE